MLEYNLLAFGSYLETTARAETPRPLIEQSVDECILPMVREEAGGRKDELIIHPTSTRTATLKAAPQELDRWK